MNGTIGERIRELRLKNSLTMDDLAKRVGYNSRASISRVENGETDLPSSKVDEFAKALGTTPVYLMGWADSPRVSTEKQVPQLREATPAPTENGKGMAEFKDRLKELRQSARMTQKDLGQALEISSSTVGMYEQGERTPDIDTLESIADYFNVSVDFLLGRVKGQNSLSTAGSCEMKVCELIKTRRQELGLTVREVAECVGVGASTVSRWESGHIANMRRDKIPKLAKVLDLDPNLLTGYHAEDMNENSAAVRLARELQERPDLRVLLNASHDLSGDEMFELIDFINRIKRTRDKI